MWPLGRPYPAVIQLKRGIWVSSVEFGPGGKFLITSAYREVQIWPLDGAVPAAGRTVFEREGSMFQDATVSPSGDVFALGIQSGEMWIGSIDGGETRQLPSSETTSTVGTAGTTFSPDGRFVAALFGTFDLKHANVRVWDVGSSREIAVLTMSDGEFRRSSSFTSDGRLLTATTKGVVAWDVATGSHEVLVETPVVSLQAAKMAADY